MGVAGHPVTHHFAEDRGATGLGVLEGFEHQHTGTFADHKAIALLVERTAGRGRIVVAERQGLGAGEAGHSQGSDRRFGATAHHGVSLAQLQQPEGIANGIGAGSTGGGHRRAGPLGAQGQWRLGLWPCWGSSSAP